MAKRLMCETDFFWEDVNECLVYNWADTLANLGVQVGDISWDYDYTGGVWFDADRQDAESWMRRSSNKYILDRYPALKKYVAMGGWLALKVTKVGMAYYPDISLGEYVDDVIPGYNTDNPLKQLLINNLESEINIEVEHISAEFNDWWEYIRREFGNELTDFAMSDSHEEQDEDGEAAA